MNILKRRKDYKGIDKVCKFCKKTYNDVKGRRLYYCSDKCFRDSKKIKFICKYCNKEFISARTRNTKYCDRKCMHKDYIGREVSPEVGEKISKTKLKGTIPSRGRQIRKLAKFKHAREKTLTRDKYECQICGELGKDAHHILTVKNYTDKCYDVNNLITLCKDCHDLRVSRHDKEWESYFLFNLETRFNVVINK